MRTCLCSIAQCEDFHRILVPFRREVEISLGADTRRGRGYSFKRLLGNHASGHNSLEHRHFMSSTSIGLQSE